MPQVGFEPTIPAGERPQIYAFDRAATGTGIGIYYTCKLHLHYSKNLQYFTKMYFHDTCLMTVEGLKKLIINL